MGDTIYIYYTYNIIYDSMIDMVAMSMLDGLPLVYCGL